MKKRSSTSTTTIGANSSSITTATTNSNHRYHRAKLLMGLLIVHVVGVSYIMIVLLVLRQNYDDAKKIIIDHYHQQKIHDTENSTEEKHEHQQGQPRENRTSSNFGSGKSMNNDDVTSDVFEISRIEVLDMTVKKRKDKKNLSNNAQDISGLSKLNPPGIVKADAVIQIRTSHFTRSNSTVDEDTTDDSRSVLVVVGGFTPNFENVSKWIHFFDIQSQSWLVDSSIEMPAHIAETHQGITYDEVDDVLYIIAGQKDGGCGRATTACTRLWIRTGKFEDLPPLPEPRYSPAVELVANGAKTSHRYSRRNNNNRKYLHIFGGAGPNRKDGMTNHWRLDVEKMPSMRSNNRTDISPSISWEELESLPDAGIHGVSFISSTQGYIYYTAYCSMDQMVHPSSSTMVDCHEYAHEEGQLLHHVSDAGLTYRYPIRQEIGSSKHHPGWERVQDMPFPTCHAGSVSVKDRLVIVGGGLTTRQTRQGSAPRPLPVIQIFDAKRNEWQVFPFRRSKKRMYLFLLTTWYDEQRGAIYSLHPGNALLAATLNNSIVSSNKSNYHRPVGGAPISVDDFHPRRTRYINIEAFRSCLNGYLTTDSYRNSTTSNTVPVYTFVDKNSSGYESARRTWNERNIDRQYPDIVVFPSDEYDVSNTVKCSRRTGYRLCARNGRHSYDGSSVCTRSIVVDVTRLKQWTVYNTVREGVESKENNKTATVMARFGAGFTLGQVTDVLHSHGLVLPMGSCPSVGLTGLTLSGGQGPLSRMHGLTCDHLDSIEMVDANGSIMNATDTNDLSDLLWLARGGGTAGPHFPGIITALTFTNLVRVPNLNVLTVNSNTGRDESIGGNIPSSWTSVRIRFPPTVQAAADLIVSWHNFLISHLIHEDIQGNNRRSEMHISEQSKSREDPEWFDHLRRLTVEPWIVSSPKRRRRRRQKLKEKNLTKYILTDDSDKNNDEWERSLFLNVYFFGNASLHSDFFLPRILPMLKSWTTNGVSRGRNSGSAGQVIKMERLDHLSFQCKIGGIRNRSELISGRHGHDIGHFRWKGYSHVLQSSLVSKIPYLIQSNIRSAIQELARDIWYDKPLTRRYAEFKPLGGAIRSCDSCRIGGAFPHRKSLWLVLVNHFLPRKLTQDTPSNTAFHAIATEIEDSRILASAHRSYSRFVAALEEAPANFTDRANMYSGYVDHEDAFSNKGEGTLEFMERYYGKDNSLRILNISRQYDPHNIFRRTLPFPTPSEKLRMQISSNDAGA